MRTTTHRILPALALAGVGLGWVPGPGQQPGGASDMSRDLTPFLMFEGRAEEAMRFYVSVIPGSEIIDIERWKAGETGEADAEGKVKLGRFTVGGVTVRTSDSPISHNFTFTPSWSFFLTCRDDAEMESLSAALLEGGEALMPLDNYGFSQRFTWIVDRFGVSWQLNLE